MNGDISIGGNDLTAYQSIPSNLRIYQVGDNRSFTTGNNAAIKAVVIAPRTDFTAHNSMSFYGICCFRTIECKNNAFWFYDEAAGEVAQLSIVQ